MGVVNDRKVERLSMTVYDFHPLADIFPMLEDKSPTFDALHR